LETLCSQEEMTTPQSGQVLFRFPLKALMKPNGASRRSGCLFAPDEQFGIGWNGDCRLIYPRRRINHSECIVLTA
jgi:hypothetical protein